MWILIFGDDLKFWSFLKMKHWIYKESAHLKKFISIQWWLTKKSNALGDI